MSESSKMGLFGSKDDNTGAGTTSDEIDEASKTKENPSERYNAPYNIDSDSETYDTEALSIMDINDIIGVQAESANDSTLESEFAALSEVITAGSLGEDNIVDSCRDGQIDDKKSHESAGMASISKSLQLIGEAYISEDSQETDAEDISEPSLPKVANLSEGLRASKSDAEDAEKIANELCSEAVESSNEEPTAAEQTVAVPATTNFKEDPAVQGTTEEPKKLVEEGAKSPQIEISADSTDSAVVEKSIEKSIEKSDEEDKTENMDVDCSPTGNVVETTEAENQTKCKIEEIEENKVIDDSQVESAVVETEEPMEVDQIADEISTNVDREKIEPANIEVATDNDEKSSEHVAIEEAKIVSETKVVDPDESKKCIEEVSTDDQISSEPENVEEIVAAIIQEEAVVEIAKIVEEEPAESAGSSKNAKSDEEKLEMETDDSQIEDSVRQRIEDETPRTEIEESIGKVQSVPENVIARASPEKEEKPEERPESPQKLAIDIAKEALPLAQIVAEPEPMEVDDNLMNKQPEAEDDKTVASGSELSVNNSKIVDSVSDIPLKENTTAECVAAEPEVSEDVAGLVENIQAESSEAMLIDGALDGPLVTESSEKSSTANETVETETAIIATKEIANEESASVAEFSKESSTDTTLVDSTPEVVSKETTNEAPDSIVQLADESSSNVENSTVVSNSDSTLNEFTVRAPTEFVGDDEKMEVDAGTKTEKREKEESKICKTDTASREPEESLAVIVPEVDSAEEESTIGKAVESDTQEGASSTQHVFSPVGSPKVTEIAKTVEESIEVSMHSPGTTRHENENTETHVGETVSEKAEDEKDNITDLKDDLKNEEKEETPISSEEPEFSADKSPEVEAIKTHDDAVEANEEDKAEPEIEEQETENRQENEEDEFKSEKKEEEEKEPSISTEIPEPSIVSEAVETIAESTKIEQNGLQISIENAESSTAKSPELEAIEMLDVALNENDVVESKPDERNEEEEETKEEGESLKSTEISEPSVIIENTKVLPDAAEKDTKNEEVETKEEESSSTMETAICDANSIGESIQESEIEHKMREEPLEKVSSIESESQDLFSKPDIPGVTTSRKEMSSSSMNLDDIEEDSADEEMNLSLDPEIIETPENCEREEQSVNLLPSVQPPVDQDDGIEDIVEMNLSLDQAERIYELSSVNVDKGDEKIVDDDTEMNLSLHTGEKINELPCVPIDESNKITVEDCIEESSMTSTTDKLEDNEERFNKSGEDIDDNSKDMEPTTVSVPEMFHDEQSQTTQEMMESILETDTGNINKILDDEEAEGEALARSNALPLERAEIDELSDKLQSESEELLNKELDDPMSSQNIDSLEGLLDLDLMPESDEPTLKAVEPIGEKVMSETDDDIENIGKDVDVSLLLDETEQAEDYSNNVPKVVDEISAGKEITEGVDIVDKSVLDNTNDSSLIAQQLASPASELIDNDLDTFDLSSVVPNALETVPLVGDGSKIDLDEDLLREIAVDEDRKMELAEQLFLESGVPEVSKIDLSDDLLLQTNVQGPSKIDLPDEVLLNNANDNIVLADPVLLQSAVEADDDIAMADPDLLQSAVEADEDIVIADSDLLQSAVEADEDMAMADPDLLQSAVEADDIAMVDSDLLQSDVEVDKNIVLADPILLQAVVPEDTKIELTEDISLESAVRDQVLTDVVTDIEDLAPSSEISELESAVKFLQESEEQDIDSPLVLSPKLVDSVVDDIAQETDAAIFATDADICQDPSELVAELESLIPDPIAISEAEIISEAAKLESEKKTKEEAKLQSPVAKIVEKQQEEVAGTPLPVVHESSTTGSPLPIVHESSTTSSPLPVVRESSITIPPLPVIQESSNTVSPLPVAQESSTTISPLPVSQESSTIVSPLPVAQGSSTIVSPVPVAQESSTTVSPLPAAKESLTTVLPLPETPKMHREPREIIAKSPMPEKIEQQPLLKKSVPIPKTSILEERLKIPPKIEIPVGEVSRMCEMPTTPKTSLLIQRDAKLTSYQKMLESPKGSDKTELKIVDTPRKDSEKHDFENVGSPRIILKIAKSALADCGEPRSPKSPKIRSATNSPNPEDSPGHKLGKIKLKLSKGGHPSIIPNDNVEEICGQWHTEGTSSLSPLGMKIKFSKTGDPSIVQTDKHESSDETKEQPKHKFEEAKRTDSPIGMKIKLSRTGDPSIVQQDAKDSVSKHKDKLEMMQGSPKRTESPIGMKIKLSKSGDASIIQPEKQDSPSDEYREASRGKDKLDVPQDIPRRTESPLGMKIKLFKTGDASIVPSETVDDSPQEIKRTDSPLGMKIKLSKTRGASIVPVDSSEDVKEKLEVPEVPRRTESPLGMKIKLSKSGDASIIHSEDSKESSKHKERAEMVQESTSEGSSLGVKIKVTKFGDASIVQPEVITDTDVRTSSIGMKIKLSKTGDASIVHSDSQEQSEDSRGKERLEKSDSPIGMKIKLSKTGDASIIHNPKKSEEPTSTEIGETDHKKSSETALGMKIKLQKGGDASIVETDKKEKSTRRKDTELPLEMKIKLSKTGHPTIIACENYGESSQRPKESTLETIAHSHSHKHKDSSSPKENPGIKMLKSMQAANLHGGRSELTIEPIQLQNRKSDVTSEGSPKRKDVTISPIESKKAKLEAKLSQMLPEVTIQPITPRDQKKIMFDAKASSISRQQMNVISQEISITQVRPNKPMDLSMTDKLKSMLTKNSNASVNSDCEIIERHPELIIVNENSNSSQEVMIIEEVPALRGPDAKVPKKRGRPRRNPLPLILAKPLPQAMLPADSLLPRDPLALDDVAHTAGQLPPQNFVPKENERPKRTCSRQKSYAPPRRGRGRGGGRGKRKMEVAIELGKKPRIEQDLDMIERSTTALITIDEPAPQPDVSHNTSELYKALRQPPMDSKVANAMARVEAKQVLVEDTASMTKSRMESLMDSRLMTHLGGVMETNMSKSTNVENFDSERKMSLDSICDAEGPTQMLTDQMEKSELLPNDEKIIDKGVVVVDDIKEVKDASSSTDHQNWLTPSSKKQLDARNETNISNVQVIDEETRMSAESGSRSQTPARNMSVQAPETIVNEESQGSVLSTATTESEKVKVKNRRMEINFDPDEGPFTVDKIAEYEWPPDPARKSETFMIQEQISQYLGVKSFKRKYPDLKRRMVDMEERNFLRENALVSEAMCDMGLTAVSSSEVLDVMCSDFPDQYEEYRKYIRDKQMKEHSKKQKELTAAANAERNRIDLAEMAVQSALSWNVGLNKARRESRKCSLDLQTFTIHVPKKQQKVEEESKVSHYPVALIPGQYTDYYREYTPAELRYYPLNTVLYGPMKPNERKFDSQSEGSQSDSDSESSSDDSSSSSTDGTQDTEESQSTMDEADVELSRQKEDIKSIKCKMCLKHLNKFSRTEVLIQCGTCNGYVHPSCIDLTLDMVPHIQAYAWQCTDCKTCAQCHDPADEDKMLFCDMCDRGYHIYCVGLRRVPQGRWHCQECAVCASCGSREAGGANSDRNSVAQWQHEYKKGDKNTRVYVSTLCVPCSKLCGDQGSDNRQEKLPV